jgi:hypothetical protein
VKCRNGVIERHPALESPLAVAIPSYNYLEGEIQAMISVSVSPPRLSISSFVSALSLYGTHTGGLSSEASRSAFAASADIT